MPRDKSHHTIHDNSALPRTAEYRMTQLLSQYVNTRKQLKETEVYIHRKQTQINAAIFAVQEKEEQRLNDQSKYDELTQSIQITSNIKEEYEQNLKKLNEQKENETSRLKNTLNTIRKEVNQHSNAGGELLQVAKNLLGHPTSNAIGMNERSITVDKYLIDTIEKALQQCEEKSSQELKPYNSMTCKPNNRSSWIPSSFGFFHEAKSSYTHYNEPVGPTYTM